MVDNGNEEIKTKRLEALVKAREVARQNRLAASAEKKLEHKKELQQLKLTKDLINLLLLKTIININNL